MKTKKSLMVLAAVACIAMSGCSSVGQKSASATAVVESSPKEWKEVTDYKGEVYVKTYEGTAGGPGTVKNLELYQKKGLVGAAHPRYMRLLGNPPQFVRVAE